LTDHIKKTILVTLRTGGKFMKTTAISKLKTSLSEYLLKVKAGEEVIVTDRGKPVAKIVPIKRGEIEIPPHLLTLEKAGLVRIGKGALPGGFWNMPRPKDKKGLALAKLLEERKEGR
jgi:prevent-host-death family protein